MYILNVYQIDFSFTFLICGNFREKYFFPLKTCEW